MQIILFSPSYSPRLDYVLKVFFSQLSPCPYVMLHDEQAYKAATGWKINYSSSRIATSELWISPETLLFDTKRLYSYPIQVNFVEGCPWLHFGTSQAGDLPADPLAGAFYCLSRYEEYLLFTPDQHGRFSATQSLAQREGFLHMAVVQRWLDALLQALQTQNPDFSWTPIPYRFVPTYDVDMPWAFAYQAWWRQLGGAGKALLRGKIQSLGTRWRAWKNPSTDPFFRFDTLHAWHERYQLQPRFFILLGDRTRYDTNPSPDLPAQRALIRDLASRYPLGIHPSYQSNAEPERLLLEKERLAEISGQNITHSRQHFLKLHLPNTYQQLIKAGIEADHSMGYADAVGFRAGVAVPFCWYDLEQECITNLWIHPFVAMDVTLQQYLGLNAEQAFAQLTALQKELHAWGGDFCLLWHNSSFYAEDGWLGWEEMYEQVLAKG